jgi:ABC-type lipoprotein export system ATPase subunit
VAEPSVVLADEPTGNLDSRASDEIARLLRQVSDAWGRSVVVVTHDAGVAAYTDRIMSLRDGAIVDQRRRESQGTGNPLVSEDGVQTLA